MRPPGAAGASLWEAITRVTAPRATAKGTVRIKLRSAAPHLPAHPTPVKTSAQQSQWRDALASVADSIAGGVFRSIRRPGPPYPIQATPSRLGVSPLRAQPLRYSSARPVGRSFGPSPRPVLHTPRTSQVGLGTARNFSSSRPVFQNVINNVPLGLRALADGDGLDQRKWRQTVRDIRRQHKTAVKGKGRLDIAPLKTKADEFASYFTAPAAAVVAPSASTEEFAITLIIPLEPELGHLLSTSELTPSFSSSYRLLTPDVLRALDSVTAAFEYQAHRIRSLTNSLSRAGVDEDPNVRMQACFGADGVKEVHIVFGGRWTKADVLQATGDWNRSVQAQWYRIVDPAEQHDQQLFESVASTPAESLCSVEDSLDRASTHYSASPLSPLSLQFDHVEHDLVASSFRFPTSLDTFDTPETSNWGDASSEAVERASILLDESDAMSDIEAAEPAGEWDTVWSESQLLYYDGVHEHLEDLEMLERTRAFSRATSAVSS